MGMFGRIFGGDKETSKVIDKVSDGLDKLFYTQEEKAEHETEARKQAASLFLAWMDKTRGQNLARRVLAFSIVGAWLGMYIFSSILFFLGVWWTANSEPLLKSGELIKASAVGLNTEAALIIGYYFAAPHIDKFVTPLTERLRKKNNEK